MALSDSARRARDLAPRIIAAVAFIGVVVFFFLQRPDEPAPAAAPPPDGGEDATAPARRCAQPSPSAFRIGEGTKAHYAEPRPAEVDEEAELLPFAVQLGRATVYAGGFAVGVKRDQDGRSVVEVALLSAAGQDGRLVGLGSVRGDLDAPLVVGRDKRLVAAVPEPNAGGLALRLVSLDDVSKPRYGAEITQGRDESPLFDLAYNDRLAVVVWDDVLAAAKSSRIMLATVDAVTLAAKGEPQAISRADCDAEAPRVVERPGGFWLAYVARRAVELPARPTDKDLDRDPDSGRYAAEKIEPSWLELLPLDEAGRPAGEARQVTPRDGHVLAYDLDVTEDGGAALALRDDDAPSGAHGGEVKLVLVGLGGAEQTQLITPDAGEAGVPYLLGGWLALARHDGQLLLAPVAVTGEIDGVLAPEPRLGRAQPLVARGSTLLLASPYGRAVDLTVASCDRAVAPPTGEAGAAPAPSGSAE